MLDVGFDVVNFQDSFGLILLIGFETIHNDDDFGDYKDLQL